MAFSGQPNRHLALLYGRQAGGRRVVTAASSTVEMTAPVTEVELKEPAAVTHISVAAPSTPWRSFAQMIGPFYAWLGAQDFGKPIMLSEYGSSADSAFPGLETAWYSDIAPALHASPSIKALISRNSATAQCDMTLSSTSASARAAYRQTGLDPYLRQQLP